MSCFNPLDGYHSKVIGASGKRGITFDRGASFSGVRIRIPCGQCVGCRLEKSRQWAMRCLHEKRLHERNCFVTLTYNDASLPPYGNLVKRDLQLFMKRLRKEKGNGIRFYACGEYGDVNKRPHYHLLLFNCDFDDKRQVGANRRGDRYYDSLELRSIWTVDGKALGHVSIGEVTFDSAAYVARYVMKKVLGKGDKGVYDVRDADGVVHRRIPEFTLMSRRPGIGTGWFERFGKETYAHDSVIVNQKPVRPPRFYDGKFELIDPKRMAVIKEKRRGRFLSQEEFSARHKESLVDRRITKRKLAVKMLANLHREV